MKRTRLFEFLDLSWYPDSLRRVQTDYLQFVATLSPVHRNLAPLLVRTLAHAGTRDVLDLCSGGSGPWYCLHKEMERLSHPVSVKLTDEYPHKDGLGQGRPASESPIEYLAERVNATSVPPHLKGMRTLFEGFHHFAPEQAKGILQDAVRQDAAIGVFEASLLPPFGPAVLALSPLMTILAYLVLTPFIKPHTIARFLWTYLVPIVPLTTSWDGVVSLLRVYSPQELHELTADIPSTDFRWEIGVMPAGNPLFGFIYLPGYPE